MEAKKISFGFSKINKKPNILPTKSNTNTESKVELIKCLEGQEIKLVEEKPEQKPLVIPLKDTHKTSSALASLIKRRAVLLGEEEQDPSIGSVEKSTDPSISSKTEGHDDIEKRAVRELLTEVEMNGVSNPENSLVLPVVKADDLPLEGAKESTLDDYESVPIEDFGKALLRGMGWKEPSPKINKKATASLDEIPVARPKGMGLGADKALNKKPLLVAPEANEVLDIKRNAYVLILGGKHKDLYGQIEGFDDNAGRVIVKMAIGGSKEVFNEFLCQPVSKKEYNQYGKCINSSKYEEYKRKENEYGQIILNKHEQNMDRYGKDVKKERRDSVEIEHQKIKRHHYKEDKKDIERECDSIRNKMNNLKESKVIYDHKNSDKDDNEASSSFPKYRNQYKDHKKEFKKSDDVRDHKTEYHDRNRRNEYHKIGESYSQRENDRYKYKSDHQRAQTAKRNIDHNEIHYSRNCGRSSNNDIDAMPERDQHTYSGRAERSHGKTIDLNVSPESKSDSYSRKRKKSKKKSKKYRKNNTKSKCNKHNSSDTETTSTDSTSSDSVEEKHIKHKKKTKKSKRQRERSRSRERR